MTCSELLVTWTRVLVTWESLVLWKKMLSKIMETDLMTTRVVTLESKKNILLRLLHKQSNKRLDQMVTQLLMITLISIKLAQMTSIPWRLKRLKMKWKRILSLNLTTLMMMNQKSLKVPNLLRLSSSNTLPLQIKTKFPTNHKILNTDQIHGTTDTQL